MPRMFPLCCHTQQISYIMYCKHCGKQITDDSSFCQYCGKTVIDEPLLQKSSTILPVNNKNFSEESTSEVIIVTQKANPIQVEVSKKSKDNSSTIANEIVGNLKMVGIALCIFFVYMICVGLIHSKDAKPLDENSYWGESCYDPTSMNTSRMFHWQQHYAMKVCMAPNFKNKGKNIHGGSSDFENLVFAHSFEPINASDHSLIMGMNGEEALSYANREAKEKQLPQSILKQYEEEAKKDAEQDRQSFNDEISSIRKYAYEKDLKKNATYAAIISLLVMILGRYFVKSVKWVNANKTK